MERSAPKPQTTLYDAVAGRVTSEGFLPVNPATSKYRGTVSRSLHPISPETALFRRKGRPFQGDNDPYWAHERLTPDQRLPDSDLLKALHTYASDFYGRNFGDEAEVDFRSFDETALLALGMLLEEMTDEVLGDTGDLALTEGEAVVRLKADRGDARIHIRDEDASMRDASTTSGPVSPITQETSASKARGSKRRKTKHNTTDK